jgi:hypothetical protein
MDENGVRGAPLLELAPDGRPGSWVGGMKLTRTQQRQMKKLAHHVERVRDADRVFFEQHPDRKHRIRFVSEVEIAQLEIMNGEVMTLPPGMRHFVIVRNVAPGARLGVFVTNAKHAGTDVPEDLMASIFDAVAPVKLREIEAMMRGALSRDRGGA